MANGGHCCANCAYGAEEKTPNPFRPARECVWVQHFKGFPKPLEDMGNYRSPSIVPDHLEGCVAWEKKA
jgi:hypothetical protein